MIKGHGGNIFDTARRLACSPMDIIDVSSNMNVLGPPPGMVDYLKKNLETIAILPEVDSATICGKLARSMGLNATNILAGGGTTQFIYAMIPALKSHRVLIVSPTYSDYADACRVYRVQPDFLFSQKEAGFYPDLDQLDALAGKYDTVVLCNPNNPTGVLIPRDRLKAIFSRHRKTRFIVDESYLAFADDGESHSFVGAGFQNVVVLHSFSKIYRLPGLRVGFLVAKPEIIEQFRHVAMPWSVNGIAQSAVNFLVDNVEEMDRFIQASRRFIRSERQRFTARLADCSDLLIFNSQTSFILIEMLKNLRSADIVKKMAHRRILVRDCSNFQGLNERFIRLSLQTAPINTKVADVLVDLIEKNTI